MKKSLGYSAGTVIATLAMLVSLAGPASAEGHHNQNHGSSNHVTNSYNTETNTNTTTTTSTVNTAITTTKTFTNSGIIQKGGGHGDGEREGGSGKQIAVQGNYSGVYKVDIHQDQNIKQESENSNVAGSQTNMAGVSHNVNVGISGLHETDGTTTTAQSNSLTNTNDQNQSQSNSTDQNQVVSQTATGVSL